ncbi:hypothetical protein RhiXN_03958 [Rhizoctonia solani]|uniref:Uncharacterized protein n=1 Tax=Rhizoctonia solani TaxID=456999 RepID=A0A8H8ST64_9AGAM|nr:uncharacterized protein RhiXN_03958 [Rhizoctonia solani]QRW15957.1 hypothetical protein RhiXN_03958 [Rhizoctonia solani]
MFLARIALTTLVMWSSISMTSASDVGLNYMGESGVVPALNAGILGLEDLISKARGAQPVMNLHEAMLLISSCNDVSISIATGMNTFDMGPEAQLIDIGGSNISLEELGEKYAAYQKSLVHCMSLVKDTQNVKVGDVMQEIALHATTTHDALQRIYPQMTNMPTAVDTAKYYQGLMSTILALCLVLLILIDLLCSKCIYATTPHCYI